MKRKIYSLKLFIGLFAAAILLFTGCKTSQQDAALQLAENQAKFEVAVQALNDREFVLEADRINFKRGRVAYVTANTNFVALHGSDATIQMAFNSPYAGPNGIGGITLDGRATSVDMKTDKKGNITFDMTVQGPVISAKVTLQMIKGTNQCTATILPTFSGNRISFTGYLYPESESAVYKGRSI